LDASGSSGQACDEPGFIQGQHHLVDGGSGDLEMATHVGFGRGPFEDPAIGVDEGQVLALGLRKAGSRRRWAFVKCLTHFRFIRASTLKEVQLNIKCRVELSQSERDQLDALLSGGRHATRKIKRAQMLVAANDGLSDEAIAATLKVSGSTIYRTKRRFVEANLKGALSEEPRPGVARKLSSKEEALLAATACSKPPPGRARWTLELLADEMVRLTDHEELSSETVRRRLAENHLKPWRKDMWCIPKVDGEYVARMEDVLDLYAEAPDPQRPVVCFDESPTQLIGEVRQPIPAKPGQLERYDCEYRRNGTVNLFVFLDAHRPRRRVKVTDRRTNQDFAECMRELVDIDYPDAPIIRVVMDNLSTHSAGALYDAFPAPEARRVLKRLQFHHTPKHASWLNMVEIEIGVLRSQCLDRRIDDKQTILAEVAAWQQRRNAEGAQIRWMFTTQKAREKLRKAYPVKES
jgi:transposase